MTLADELKRLRRQCRMSLRQVEQRTGVSNAYLSQLENRHVLNPSPHLLRKLAEAYGVPHEQLLRAAGYVDAKPIELPPRIAALLAGVQLSNDQEQQLASFVRTLISRR